VGRWFNRDIYTGACDMELVKERGLYNVEGTKRSVYLRESPKMMEEPRIEIVR
jgi:hypothetical protein